MEAIFHRPTERRRRITHFTCSAVLKTSARGTRDYFDYAGMQTPPWATGSSYHFVTAPFGLVVVPRATAGKYWEKEREKKGGGKKTRSRYMTRRPTRILAAVFIITHWLYQFNCGQLSRSFCLMNCLCNVASLFMKVSEYSANETRLLLSASSADFWRNLVLLELELGVNVLSDWYRLLFVLDKLFG